MAQSSLTPAMEVIPLGFYKKVDNDVSPIF